MGIIYLDNCATTRCDPEVAAAMVRCLLEDYGNPSSVHSVGRRARYWTDEATRQVASLLGARPDEIIFTSGATEANNLALVGSFAPNVRAPAGLVVSPIGHKSVLAVGKELGRQGVRVTALAVDRSGRIIPESLADSLDEHTRLVSIEYVNSELGVIQPVEECARICRERGVPLHVDAVQAVGKIPINLNVLPVDMLSLSAHKFHGPKGIGALYVRGNLQPRLRPLIVGGGQHRLRGGTLPAPLIVGMGLACEKVGAALEATNAHASMLRERFIERMRRVEGFQLNTHLGLSIPHVVNFHVPGIASESVVSGLRDVALSSGSACNSSTAEPSYVLTAIGLTNDQANSSLRVCFGPDLQTEDIDRATDRLIDKLNDILGALGGW